MQVMWWGGILQSLSTDFFLKLRHSATHHSSKFFKRLDASESTSSENSAFADSWLRADYFDLNALARWCVKSNKSSLVVIDLWGFVVLGRSLDSYSNEIDSIIENSGHVVFLLPKAHFSGWFEALQRDASDSSVSSSQMLTYVDALKLNYEFLLNFPSRFGMIESSITFKDFCQFLDLEFNGARKFAGIVHLIPRDVAQGPLGFTSESEFCDALLAMLQRLEDENDRGSLMSLRFTRPESFLFTGGASPRTAQRNRRVLGFVTRRRDGAFALCSNWSLYLKTVSKAAQVSRANGLVLGIQDREFLVFILRYEALQSTQVQLSEPQADALSRFRLPA